jgi:tetrahydromethanopterin S-methyltransferase subunit E
VTERANTVDFGAPDSFGAHLFRVEIPVSRNGAIVIVEDYGYRAMKKESFWRARFGLESLIPPVESLTAVSRPQ